MKAISKIPGVYPKVEVEYEIGAFRKVKLISVKENGREIVHLLKPSTVESIKQDCKNHAKGEKRKGKGN